MSDKDSFDPRSWGGKSSAASTTDVPAPLPEAWRAVTALQPALATPQQVGRAAKSLHLNQAWLAPATSLIILLAGAATAWGMRVTPQPVVVAAAPEVVEAAAPPDTATAIRRIVLGGPADLHDALIAAGLATEEADAAARAAISALGGATGEIRANLTLHVGPGVVHLSRLEASHPDGSGAVVTREAAGAFTATRVAAELTKQIRVVSGELDAESFYSSAVTAGVTDTLIPEFINAFAFDFNLASEIKAGDTFEVAYEQTVSASGDAVGQPQLVYASLTTPTKSRALYRYKPEGQDVGWFDGNGASTVRSFMRTPVDGARISSKFGPRFHPTLHYTRLHGGVDFAAPTGTPIYAAAGGVVTTATPSGCAGNIVIMRHDNGWETRYFHLSRYADGLAAGTRVEQGFTIGLVGNTGTCTTGPHLHYEVHVEGQKVDPLGITTDAGRKALETAALAAFKQVRDRVDVARAAQAQ